LQTAAVTRPLPEAGLVRAIGVRRLAAILVNVTVGAGIFVLPATAAAGLGHGAPFAYIACAVAMTLIVACIAAAGSRVALTGGIYAYTECGLGPFVGFLAGVLYWTSASFGVASVATALVGSIAVLWPPADQGATRIAIVGGAFAALAWVNVRGVTLGSRVVEVVTVAKLLPLAVLVAAGLWLAPIDPRTWFPVPAAPAIGQTAIVLLFAFVGIEVALVPSGEIREPARTVPRAAFLALTFTTLLYLAIQAVAQGVLGDAMTDFETAPLAETAARLLGPAGRLLILAGTAVSMFGYLSGDMLCTPRALFAFGRDRLLPRAFASVHPRFHTPWLAILVHTVIITALSTTGSFTQLVVMANVSTLILYLLCVAAAYQLQRRDVRLDDHPLVLPGGPLIPLAASVVILWLLWQATARELLAAGGVLMVASLWYAYARLRRNLQLTT
jgi:basic amino acid/polyamine antiporter, APA family